MPKSFAYPQFSASEIEAELPPYVINASRTVISPKTYGAKWDGVTDDTKPLEEAIAASVVASGVPIVLPAGTGVIASTIKIPKNLSFVIPIRGAGEHDTTVKLTSALQFLSFANTVAGDTVGNLQFTDCTIDGNNLQVSGPGTIPIIGTSTSCNEQVNIRNVRIRRVRMINIPNLEESSNARRCLSFSVNHPTPELAENKIEHIEVGECDLEGSQYGIFVGAECSGPLPANVYMAHVHIFDLVHTEASTPLALGNNAHVQIGKCAWSDGKGIVVERCVGAGSCDVGAELDIPCTINDCLMENQNNSGYLFTTFNCATTKAPVVAKTTAIAKVNDVSIAVTNHTGMSVGDRVVIGSGLATRTIKAFADATHIEFTEALTEEYASGTWIQWVDDMNSVQWKGNNLKYHRTVSTMPGTKKGLTLQNPNNSRPCPELNIEGYTIVRNAEGLPASQGEMLSCAPANGGSPTALRIKNIKADVKGLSYAGSEAVNYEPFYLIMPGALCPIELQGELNIEGPGITSTGKLGQRIFEISADGIFEADILTQIKLTSTGGEGCKIFCPNRTTAGDLSGRIRHRTKRSVITEGGGTFTGINFGKACAYASKTTATTLKGGALAAKSTVIPVVSTEGFAAGQKIVIDALSTTKSEVFIVSSVEAGVSLTVVSLGETPGTVLEHTEPCTVALLRTWIVEDSDWVGLGSAGSGMKAEDEAIFLSVRSRGNTYPSPIAAGAVTIPASTKAFAVSSAQKGQDGTLSIQGGTVTAVEYSSDGKSFFKASGVTGILVPANSGDVFKLTWAVEPTVKFIPGRI